MPLKRLRLLMISAMYENGGNTTHRFLDGHPELLTYPFESQLGTPLVQDHLSSIFPFKYRWPVFPLTGSFEADFELFFDEEYKTRVRAPRSSKFRDAAFDATEASRKAIFLKLLEGEERTSANVVSAFFASSFDAWKNLNRTGRETAVLGYSPIVGVDAERIFGDFPDAHVIHVVRNPYSAYADTKKRPFPLSLERYAFTWSLVQQLALQSARAHPESFHMVRFEDIVKDPRRELASLCAKIGLADSETLGVPSWNSVPLAEVYPWGTIRNATTEANLATMGELSDDERREIKGLTSSVLGPLGYEDF